MATLETTVNGLRFPNPFVIGSGPPGTNANVIGKALDEGWGAVICKTVSLDAGKVVNVQPRYARLRSRESGEIRINGRLSALIEVGSGFHPELTGRENIYLSGSILGMRRREIVDKLERIIEFAGVRDFIDTPVTHYSS